MALCQMLRWNDVLLKSLVGTIKLFYETIIKEASFYTCVQFSQTVVKNSWFLIVSQELEKDQRYRGIPAYPF